MPARPLLALLLSGCSFLFTSSPETRECVPRRVPPVLDTVAATIATAAVALGAGNLAFGCKNDNDGICSGISAGMLVFGGVTALVEWPSAIVGWSRASRCEELRSAGR